MTIWERGLLHQRVNVCSFASYASTSVGVLPFFSSNVYERAENFPRALPREHVVKPDFRHSPVSSGVHWEVLTYKGERISFPMTKSFAFLFPVN